MIERALMRANLMHLHITIALAIETKYLCLPRCRLSVPLSFSFGEIFSFSVAKLWKRRNGDMRFWRTLATDTHFDLISKRTYFLLANTPSSWYIKAPPRRREKTEGRERMTTNRG